MTPKIKLVGLDLDGTVFNDQKQITPRTQAAIRRAIEAGCQVLPVTGRIFKGLPVSFTSIPGVRWAVTANGAAILDLADGGRCVQATYLKRADALDVLDLCLPFDTMLDVYTGGEAVTQADRFARLEDFSSPAMLPYFRTSRTVVEDLRAFVAACPTGIEKITMMFAEEAQRASALALLSADRRFLVTSSLPNNLEVNDQSIDKGKGLLALAAILGIRPEETMAVGDSSNDLAMLRAAGLGVAMGNGSAEAKAAADVTTDDNNHDGAAKAIERYVLGQSE